MAVCSDRGIATTSISLLSAKAVTRTGGARDMCSPPATTAIPIPMGDLIGPSSHDRCGWPCSASAPMDSGPDSLVKIIPGYLRNDLEGGDRTRDRYPACQEPTDRKRVERSQGAPTDGLEDRPR